MFSVRTTTLSDTHVSFKRASVKYYRSGSPFGGKETTPNPDRKAEDTLREVSERRK